MSHSLRSIPAHPDRKTLSHRLRILIDLTKARVTSVVTLSAATGYCLAAREVRPDIWVPLLGTFLLACGASALNEWQESDVDARMRRTRNRPIPAGRIEPTTALGMAILLILTGLSVLTVNPAHAHRLLVLGGLTLVWYNGVYTYLKRIWAFAVVPGSLIGAIPPVIGYVAGGGAVSDPLILLVASFFFLWQIPHFWLLLLMVGEQYERAGLPTLTRVFTRAQIGRITFMWILATAIGGMSFPVLLRTDVDLALAWKLVLVLASIWLAAKSSIVLRATADNDSTFRRAFVQINAYVLVVMLCLSLNALGLTWNGTF
jgi:protoheme IX farnesyltransferase